MVILTGAPKAATPSVLLLSHQVGALWPGVGSEVIETSVFIKISFGERSSIVLVGSCSVTFIRSYNFFDSFSSVNSIPGRRALRKLAGACEKIPDQTTMIQNKGTRKPGEKIIHTSSIS